jgi:type II secretory pathway component PulF
VIRDVNYSPPLAPPLQGGESRDMKDIQIFSGVSYLDKVSFTKHLSVMIKSGIVISEAISTLVPQTKNRYFRLILNTILSDIENGQPFSKALARFPKVFDSLYINLVKVGEESGTLDENLIYLAEKLKKDYSLRKKIQSVMIYPTIVVTVAVVMGGYISIFVLPELINFFDSLNAKLPLSTQILLWFANLMKNYGIIIFAGLGAIIVGIKMLLQTSAVKPHWHEVLLKFPVFGQFTENVQLASFCRNLGVMLKSGLSITSALEIAEKGTDNLVFSGYIARIRNAVVRGKSIAAELSSGGFSHVPVIATKMIAVGEKTGKLDESLIYLGDFFEEEVDNTAKNFATIIEPVIFIVIGLVVAFLAFAIITPIYELMGSINK